VIIVDTGAWVGLANKRDQFHQRCVRFFRDNREALVTTNPVLVETVHLLYQRVGVHMTLAFLDTIHKQSVSVHRPKEGELVEAIALMRRYRNLPMDLADASLVLLAEALGDGRIVSTDQRDFDSYRWKNHQPFKNLLMRSL
jgi:predicted nucleic acid-binding protein